MTVTTNDANDETYTPDATTYVEVSSIAEFNALEVGTLAKLTLNNAQVNGVDWSTAYVEDASAAVEFDGLNLDLDTYTKTSGNELQPTLFTMAELLNDANFSKLVALNSVAISLNGRFYIAEADGLQVRVNDMLGYLPQDYEIPENGELCNITGIFSWNGLAYQIYLTSVDLPTAVTNLQIDKNDNDGPVFDINGRLMHGTLPAGVYIKNGHKFIVR